LHRSSRSGEWQMSHRGNTMSVSCFEYGRIGAPPSFRSPANPLSTGYFRTRRDSRPHTFEARLQMTRMTAPLLAALAALLMLIPALPAAAQSTGDRVYDPVTNTWRSPDGRPFIRVRSNGTETTIQDHSATPSRAMSNPIPRETVAYQTT